MMGASFGCRSLWRHLSGVIWVIDEQSNSCRRYAKSGNGRLVILPKYNCSAMRYVVEFAGGGHDPYLG
jgi:hypothetical protein